MSNRSGKRPKLSPSNEKMLVRMFKSNPVITDSEVSSELETTRQKFAAAHMDKPNTMRRKAL